MQKKRIEKNKKKKKNYETEAKKSFWRLNSGVQNDRELNPRNVSSLMQSSTGQKRKKKPSSPVVQKVQRLNLERPFQKRGKEKGKVKKKLKNLPEPRLLNSNQWIDASKSLSNSIR